MELWNINMKMVQQYILVKVKMEYMMDNVKLNSIMVIYLKEQ